MSEDIVLRADRPQDIGELQRQRICELVIEGGEVGSSVLSKNIANARILVRAFTGDVLGGVAALKHPQDSYRAKVSLRSGFELAAAEFPFEIGYIYLQPQFRGRGYAHHLVNEALKHEDGRGVFATVREDNHAMRASLKKAGFCVAGTGYAGASDRRIGLLVRPSRGTL